MKIKTYQIVILSFALGIFTVASLGIYLVNKISKVFTAISVTPVPIEYQSLKIYFPNSHEDPQSLYCDRTYPIERPVNRLSDNSKSTLAEYAYLAISELLNSPTVDEKEKGFFTSISDRTKVNRIIIENGIATVDFNDRLSEGVAGSCRVQTIRSQITETLKQFSEINEVIISVDGRSKDALQP